MPSYQQKYDKNPSICRLYEKEKIRNTDGIILLNISTLYKEAYLERMKYRDAFYNESIIIIIIIIHIFFCQM